MSSPVAFVILAHNDPRKVRRLIGALGGADVFLHCDARTPDSVAHAMLPERRANVRLVERGRAKLASWSLVTAELRALEAALRFSDAEHIVVMSGACYPLASYGDICDDLAQWRGRSRFELHPLPFRGWNSRWLGHGGLGRLSVRFLGRGDDLITIGDRPIPGGRSRIPPELELYGSSAWKIYARRHVQALLETLSERPEQTAFWRHVFIPEESCVASILRSPALVGDLSKDVVDDHLWAIRWHGESAHPEWLGAQDIDMLRTAKDVEHKLFARKVGSQAADLLDLIDSQLRCETSTA